MSDSPRFNGCHCARAVSVRCTTDYCDPKPHPHAATILVRTPWLSIDFAPVCRDALAVMKKAPEIQHLWHKESFDVRT